MSVSAGPSIVTDGLVFHYDMSNTQKSWKGKPTVNYITSPTNEVIATASEFAIFQDLSPIFDTYGEGSYSITADIKTPKPGGITVYTASGGVEYNIGYFSASCDTYYKTFYFNNISVTRTDAAQTVSNLSFYGGYGSGLFPSIKNVQVEKNSFATPFVVGTRSSTQAIVDLTGRNTITANSLTYASDGTFSFDGSSNNLSIGSFSGYSTNLTCESWFKTTSGATWKNIICGPGGDVIFTVNGALLNFGTQNSSPIPHANYSTTTVNTGAWFHGVATYDGSNVRIYINGNLESTNARTGIITSGAKNIGSNSGGSSEYFNGTIGTVRVYDRALSDAEVQQNFNSQRTRYGI